MSKNPENRHVYKVVAVLLDENGHGTWS